MFYSNFNGTDTFELNRNFPPLTPDPAIAISDSSLPFVSYNLVSFNFAIIKFSFLLLNVAFGGNAIVAGVELVEMFGVNSVVCN